MRVVQAFVSCRLDYCNSLFFGISKGLMNRLQSVHGFRTPPPVWLLAPDAPTTYRRCSVSYTGYRYASASTSRWPHSYTSRCLAFHHRTWPTTAVLIVADARERRLRSTASRTCVVTRTYSTFGDRAFGAAGRPRIMEQSYVAPERR